MSQKRRARPLTDAQKKRKRETNAARYRSNRESILAKIRMRLQGDGGRDANLRRRYGITLVEYRAMELKQGGACAICRRPFVKQAHVDHDHASGVIRGLLCGSCNGGLGIFADNRDRLLRAADYLLLS